jgi:hypothetical protein
MELSLKLREDTTTFSIHHYDELSTPYHDLPGLAQEIVID